MPALFPSTSRLILRQSLRALAVWTLMALAAGVPAWACLPPEPQTGPDCADVCVAPLDRAPL